MPAGSVPGMVVDGQAFHGSNALVELVEELVPTPPLLPADPFGRARARALLDFHDNRVEAAARAMFPLVKRDWRAEPEEVEEGVAAVEAALARLSDLVAPAPFHLGAEPTIADMAFPAPLQMAGVMGAGMARPRGRNGGTPPPPCPRSPTPSALRGARWRHGSPVFGGGEAVGANTGIAGFEAPAGPGQDQPPSAGAARL